MQTIIEIENDNELEINKLKIEQLKQMIGNTLKIKYKKFDIIDKLLAHPKKAINFKPLKREMIYE